MNKKQFQGISVLVFGGGGKQVIPICRGFYELGCVVTVYGANKRSAGFLTRFTHDRILYDINNEYHESFNEYGLRLIKTGKYDLVVPLGDTMASFLSEHKSEASQYAKIAVNDWPVFGQIIDKMKTMRVCQENDIPAPMTLFSDDPLNDIKKSNLSFPVVVKPKTAVGSIGFNIVENEEKLRKLLESYQNQNGPLFVQEYVAQHGQPQYCAEMFRDRDGNIKAALIVKKARWYPIDGGSAALSISCHDEEIKNTCVRLLDVLGWNGYADFDLVWDEKENRAKILEINGRISAIVKICFISGVNVAQLILENELGYPVTDMTSYEDGKQISYLPTDILWFLKSKTRFTAKPSWFARGRIKDTVFYWDDPLPSVGFLLENIKSLNKTSEKRKRFDE